MKKKAFTLVELLGVIVILAIILVISIPKITNVITSNKEKLYATTVSELEKVAEQYVSVHPELLVNDYFTVSISTLCSEKLIDCPVIDPRDNSEMAGVVMVNYNNGDYTYEYNED